MAVAVKLRVQLRKVLASGFTLDTEVECDGGFHILFGASGAGKTTLLNCIAGLNTPDAGQINLGDETLFDRQARVDVPTHQRRVGYVLQSQALFPHLSVLENLRFGVAASDSTQPDALIAQMELGDLLQRRPSQLSAGQRQRVAVARTLLTEPRCVLMDEPLAALDAATKAKLLQVLREWNAKREVPILFVTHDREEAYSLGERLLVMEEGKIVASGTPNEVFRAPARQPIAQLAGFENLLRCTIVGDHPDQGTMSCRVSGTEVILEAPLTRVAGSDVTLGVRAGDILLASERPNGISARNVLKGTVETVERRGVLVRVLINAGSARFEAHVTPGAQISLDLVGGKTVWLVIKTYSCHLLTE